MKNETDAEYAARKVREVLEKSVVLAEESAKFAVHAAKKEERDTLLLTAEVRRRLGMR